MDSSIDQLGVRAAAAECLAMGAQMTSKRALVNGVTLHYVTIGSGPAVLCLHGWPQNHREFVPIFAAFAQGYRFIAPDLRGYADSDKPYTDYMPATIAQDLLELADVEKV